MLDKIRRRVGQLEKAQREIMEPKSHIGTEGGVVPGNPKGGKTGPGEDSMDREEDISPEFIICFTQLKWECLRTEVSMAVLQRPFPKPPKYKQLKEDVMIVTLSRLKTRHLKKVGKLDPLCVLCPWKSTNS
jgi:hypothetical protein